MADTADVINLNQQTILNVNMSNVTKLTADNYLMWSLQVHAVLDGYELSGHLDGSTQQPEPTIRTNGATAVNPAFKVWKRQDKLIYNGLLGAISLTVQPLLSKAQTAADIWKTLADTYAMPSRGHIQLIKHQIKLWCKGTKTIDEYFQGLTTKFDQLALLGTPLPHEDHLEHILGGLPEEYKNVVDQVEGRDTPPSLTTLHEKLRTREAKLLAAPAPQAETPVSAHLANTRSRSFPAKQNQRPSQH